MYVSYILFLDMFIQFLVHMDIYIYGYNVFHRPHPVFSSILYIYMCVRVSEMLCTFQRCCARVRDVVHVSEMLCTCHKPPNNVRVQLYTHWAHSNQQKHWGDQTRSPDTYIYIYCIWRRFHIEYTHEIPHFWWITVPSGKRLRNYGKIHHFLLLGKSTISTGPFSMSLFLCLPVVNPHL